MMTSMSISGKFLISFSIGLIFFSLFADGFDFPGRFTPSSLVGHGERVHLFSRNLYREKRSAMAPHSSDFVFILVVASLVRRTSNEKIIAPRSCVRG